jgi:hypothetical protein
VTEHQTPAERVPAAERCGICDADIEDRHGHVVDRHNQQLVCTCRACYLLFTGEWNGGRFRAVPERYLTDSRHPLTAAAWEQLQVPVGMAFFIRGMAGREVAAFYPSPAGATECMLDLAAWNRLVEELPLFAAVEPEIEAILVRRTEGGHGDGVRAYLVPVDACYELVGSMRMNWHGFDGGAEAKAQIDEFFDSVARQTRELAPAEGAGL